MASSDNTPEELDWLKDQKFESDFLQHWVSRPNAVERSLIRQIEEAVAVPHAMGLFALLQVAEARPYFWRPLAIGLLLYVRRSSRFLCRCSRVITWHSAFVGCRALRLCRAVALGGS